MDRTRLGVIGRIRPVVAITAALLPALLGLAGCDGRDQLSRSIGEARNTLESLSVGGARAAPAALRERKFSEVLADLQKHSTGAQGASAGLAQALMAEAYMGQGEIAADRYRRADADLLRSLTTAGAALDLCKEQRALAAALAGYDPRADIEKLEQQAKAKAVDLAAAQKELQTSESRVRQILDEAKSRGAAGRQKREEESLIRAQAMSALPQERPELIERAVGLRRQGELIIKDAELLEAGAARFAPTSGEISLRIKQIQAQIASLEQAKAHARETAKALSEQSADAAEAAEQAGRGLSAAVAAVQEAMAKSVKPAFDEAMGKYTSAASRLGAAREGPSRAALQVSTGAVQHAIGSLHREIGESQARVAVLLDECAGLSPPLDEASGYAAAAKALEAEKESSLKSASEAYDKAKAAFEGGGATGDAGERLKRLAKQIGEMQRRLSGSPEPAPAAAPVEPEANPQEPPKPDEGPKAAPAE